MARPQRKRPYVRRRTRRQRRILASYRHGLKDAIGKLLPGPFFSRWRVVGSKWSPLRVFWVAILMVWSAEQTLQAQFRGNARSGAVAVSQVAAGQELHGMVPSTAEMADAAAARLEPTSATPVADQSRSALAAGRLVCVRRGRFAGGMSANGGQRKGVEVCGQEEDRTAVVRDDALAHGHGRAVGFSHRAGDGERTASSGRNARGCASAVVAGRRRGLHGLRVLWPYPGGEAEVFIARRIQCAFAEGTGVHRAGRTGHGLLVAGAEPERTAGGAASDRASRRQEEDGPGDERLGPKGVDGEERGGVVRDALGGGSFLPVAETDAGKASDAEPDARGGDVRTDVGDDGPVAVGTDDGVGDLGAGRRPVGLVGGPGARTGAAKHAPCFDAAARGSRLSTTALLQLASAA